jgi:drug/metabolite transporter (DMT)-like permease
VRANILFTRTWRYFLRQKTFGLLFVLTAAVLFGINGSLSRLLFDRGVTPVTPVEIRMIVGSLCLFGFLATQPRQAWRMPRRTWGWLVAFGLCIALVTGLLEQRLGSLDVIGLLFSLFALIAFIAYLVLGRRVGGQLHPIASTAYGAAVAGVFWLIVQPPWSIPASTWNLHTFILMVFVGIIGMAIPFSLEVAALRRLDATRAGIAAMFELPASALIAFLWLGQSLDLWQIFGCTLVLTGITLVQLEKPGKQDT